MSLINDPTTWNVAYAHAVFVLVGVSCESQVTTNSHQLLVCSSPLNCNSDTQLLLLTQIQQSTQLKTRVTVTVSWIRVSNTTATAAYRDSYNTATVHGSEKWYITVQTSINIWIEMKFVHVILELYAVFSTNNTGG